MYNFTLFTYSLHLYNLNFLIKCKLGSSHDQELRMKKQFKSLLIIIFLLSAMSLAAEVLVLDCDSAIDLALENNKDLLDASISLDTSRRSADASWNLFLPEINASLGLSAGANISSSGVADSSSLTPGLALSYTLRPGIAESLKQLALSLESSEIGYETAGRQLKESVENEFYYLLTSENNLEIQKKNIELAQRQYQQTEARYNSGMVSEMQLLQARVNAANLVPAYSSLQSVHQNRMKEFLLVIGLDPMTEVELSGSLDIETRSFDADELVDRYLMNRADIRKQLKQIEMLESTHRQAVANGTLPLASLSASLNDSISDPFSAQGWQDYSPGANLSLTLRVQLGLDDYIPGSGTDIGIKEIEDSIASAGLQMDALKQSARLEIINIVDSLETNRENLELSKLNLELSETSFRMTQASFEKGKSDRITLEDAQQDLLTAQQNLLESKYEYLSGLISLRSALGLDSLEELE